MITLSRKRWLTIAIVATIALLTTIAILVLPNAFRPRAPGDCTHYVDNHAAPGGDGTLDQPWTTIASHLDSLSPGDTLCVTGDVTTTRVYDEDTIRLETNRITLRPLEGNHVCIRNADGTGRTIELNADYCILESFEIHHAGSFYYGIHIRGDHNILRANEIHNGRNHNIVVFPGATHNEISGNHIHHIERTGDDAHGIMIQSRAHHTIVDGNTIHDCSGDGIQLHDHTWTSMDDSPADCRITNNLFYRGTLSRTESAVGAKCSNNLTIRGNTMHGYTDYRAISISKPKHGGTVLIEHNTIYDCWHGVRFADDLQPDSVTFRQNLLYNISGEAIRVWSGRNLNITHNTIANAHIALWVGNYWARGELKNNLWYASGSPVLHSGASTASIHHNGWFDTHAAGIFADPTDTVHDGPPGFVNAATHNYHLTADSPARGAGQGEADLGAFPYSEETPEPTPTTDSPLPTPTLTPTPTALPTQTGTPRPTLTPAPSPTSSRTPTTTPTPNGHWYDDCPPDPPTRTPWPAQPTLTARPTYTPAPSPTCRPTATLAPNPSPSPYPTQTPYPTGTPYPPQP